MEIFLCFPAAPASLLQPGEGEMGHGGTGACEETVCLARGLLDELLRKDRRTGTVGARRSGRGGGHTTALKLFLSAP